MANSKMKVGVIGAGVMGEALIAALIKFGVAPASIQISEKREERSDELVRKYGISSLDLISNAKTSDVILLVVKPQDLSRVLGDLNEHIKPETLLLSFVAGKKIGSIAGILNGSQPIIRIMPNTPLLVGEGMSAISVGSGVTQEQKEFVVGFLEATGKVIEVDEVLQDAVTATSGSGPAYFFAFVEAMIAGAEALGLSHSDATTLTIQTIVGAAKLLNESGDTPTTLREKVTSPQGTTAAALASFSSASLSEIVASAMKAAHTRSQELA